MLTPATRAQIPPTVLDKIKAALSTSVAYTFLWTLIPALMALTCVCLMGKEGMKNSVMAKQQAVQAEEA